MKTKITLTLVALATLILSTTYFYSTKNRSTPSKGDATTTPVLMSTNKGEVTKNQDGTNQYTNSTYRLTFLFPTTWHIGDNNLSNGTLQLFNYDESVYKKGFGINENKVEARIGTESTYVASADYPEKNRSVKQVVVAGQSANVLDVEFQTGEKVYTYFVPLTLLPGKYFIVSIYGDASNFKELDTMMANLKPLN